MATSKVLQQVLDSMKGVDLEGWCAAASWMVAHIYLRNGVTRDEFMEVCQRAFDAADKEFSPFKPN